VIGMMLWGMIAEADSIVPLPEPWQGFLLAPKRLERYGSAQRTRNVSWLARASYNCLFNADESLRLPGGLRPDLHLVLEDGGDYVLLYEERVEDGSYWRRVGEPVRVRNRWAWDGARIVLTGLGPLTSWRYSVMAPAFQRGAHVATMTRQERQGATLTIPRDLITAGISGRSFHLRRVERDYDPRH